MLRSVLAMAAAFDLLAPSRRNAPYSLSSLMLGPWSLAMTKGYPPSLQGCKQSSF